MELAYCPKSETLTRELEKGTNLLKKGFGAMSPLTWIRTERFQEIVNLSTDKKEEVYTHRLESLVLDHPANSSPDSGVQEASVVDLLTGTKPANPITLQKVRSIISCQ